MSEELGAAVSRRTLDAKSTFSLIDASRLGPFVGRQPGVEGPVEISGVEHLQTGAGSSNGITFFNLRCRIDGNEEKLRLVARYNPGVTLLKQKRFADEFQTLRAAFDAGLPVPRPYWLDETGEHLGIPGYILARVEGEAPSAGIFDKGLFAGAEPESRRAMLLAAARFHGALRRRAIRDNSVSHLKGRGTGQSPIQRELNWWLNEAELSEPTAAHMAEVRAVYDLLIANEPQVYEANLAHGDAQFANLMFKDGELAAAIDWELSYIGHNEADLAALSFSAEAFGDPAIEGVPTEAEFVAAFEEVAGVRAERFGYFKLFNIYKWMVCGVLLKSDSLLDGYRPHLPAIVADIGN